MALNSCSASLTLFSLVVATAIFSAAHGGRQELLPGGWSPIPNLNDPKVVEIANFAIDTHNKEASTTLKLERVTKGESQIVEGTNYKLDIVASDGNTYEAVVWDKPWLKFRQLTSFTQL